MTIAIFVFHIGILFIDHETAFPLQIPHYLRHTVLWWNTDKHMDMIFARLCFYDFYSLVFA